MNTNNNKLIVEEISPKEFYSKATTKLLLLIDNKKDEIIIDDTSYINIKQRTCLLSYKRLVKNTLLNLNSEHIVEIKIKSNNTATLYEKGFYSSETEVTKYKTTFNNDDDLNLILTLFDSIELILDKDKETGFFDIEKLKVSTFYTLACPFNYSHYKERIVCDFALNISGKDLFNINKNKKYDISEISKSVFHNNIYESSDFEYIKNLLRLKLKDDYTFYTMVSRIETSNKKYIIEKYLGLSKNNSFIYIIYSECCINVLKADDNSAYLFTIDNKTFNYTDKLNTEKLLLTQILKNCNCCQETDEIINEMYEPQFNEYFNKCIDKCMGKIKEYLGLNLCKYHALERFIDKIASEKHIINNPYKNQYEVIHEKDLSCINNIKFIKDINSNCDFNLKGLFYNSFLRAYKYKITFTDDQYYKHYVTLNIETIMHEPSNTNGLSTETDTIKFVIHVSKAESIKRLLYEHTLAPEEFEVH